MDDLQWRELTARFPYVPRNFDMESVRQRAERGKPLQSGDRPVIALAFSADSASIAASGGGLIPGAVDIRVFDIASRELRNVLHYHCMGVFDLAFHQETGLLASASHDYSVVLWELGRGDAIMLMGSPDAYISRSAVSFAGSKVIVADGMTFVDRRAGLTTFDLATGEVRRLFELDGNLGISRLAVLPEPEWLVAEIADQRSTEASEIRCVTVDGIEQARYPLETGLYDMAAGSNAIVAAGRSNVGETEIFVLDVASGRILASRVLGSEIGARIASAPAGGRVAVAYDRGVEVCDAETLQVELRCELGDEKACSVAWSPDGAWIGVGTLEKTVRLFRVASGTEHLA